MYRKLPSRTQAAAHTPAGPSAVVRHDRDRRVVTITGGRDAILRELAALHRTAQASLLVLVGGALLLGVGGFVAAQAGWHVTSLVAAAVTGVLGLLLLVSSYWMRTRWRDPFRVRLARELLIHLPIEPGSSVMLEVVLSATHDNGGVQIGASFNRGVQLEISYQARRTLRIDRVPHRQKVFGKIGRVRFVKRIDATPLSTHLWAFEQTIEIVVSVATSLTPVIDQLCRRGPHEQPIPLAFAASEPTAASLTLASYQHNTSVDPGLSQKDVAHCTRALDQLGHLMATIEGSHAMP